MPPTRLESVTRIRSLRERISAWRTAGLRVALVSTMGCLHRGHLALVDAALAQAERVVVTSYVNPLQFSAGIEADRYPKNREHDEELLEKAGAHLLFAPSTFEMFPTGIESGTVVDVPELSRILCGPFEPYLFSGKATILTKLFSLVQPDVAFVGEKDYQQLVIVRRLVADLSLPVEIIAVPTVREHDGLAYSTRNRLLAARDRNFAPRLYETLKRAKQRLVAGEQDVRAVQDAGLRELKSAGLTADYFVVRRASDLAPLRDGDKDLVILGALRFTATRLIDNIRVQMLAKL
jgi:pantoate--beta-alanine ligase